MACKRVVSYRRPHAASYAAHDAIAQGFARHRVAVEVADVDRQAACDLAVLWSVKWPNVIAACEANRTPYLVLERGFLGDRFASVAAGYNGLKGRADFCNCGASSDRFETLFPGLLAPCRYIPTPGPRWIVVAGQMPADSAVAGVDIVAWAQTTVDRARSLWPGAEVRFRPHPAGGAMRVRGVESSYVSLADELELADVAITYNSNFGVDAVLAGVPTVAVDRGSMAWPVTAHALDRLFEDAATVISGRAQWAAELAYAQWSLVELANGDAWDHLCGGPRGLWA